MAANCTASQTTARCTRVVASTGLRNPVYGARPLKRVIQRQLQDPLAERILAGHVRDGDTVAVTGGSDRLLFSEIRDVAA